MGNAGYETIDSVQLDTIGYVDFGRYRKERYDVQVSAGFEPVDEGDFVIATSTDSFGFIVLTPREITLLRNDLERIENKEFNGDEGPDIMCRLCGGDDDGSLVSCIYTVVHKECLMELVEAVEILIEQNKDLIISESI
jgi:hypothetical protein